MAQRGLKGTQLRETSSPEKVFRHVDTKAGERSLKPDSVAAIGGTLTGTTDGALADVADIALSTTDTYTDAAVNTAVNIAVADINVQLKELQEKVNALLVALKA